MWMAKTLEISIIFTNTNKAKQQIKFLNNIL